MLFTLSATNYVANYSLKLTTNKSIHIVTVSKIEQGSQLDQLTVRIKLE